jgi:hypothetical protein
MIRRVFSRLALGALLLAALAGCGSGGSSSPTATAEPLAITGFTPASAGAGDVVTVTGTGFSAVRSARVGGAGAAFAIDSATQVRVTVPAGATTGRIELATADRTVLSAVDLTVVAVPQVTSVSPTSIVPPARITVTGTSLDLVQQARLGNTLLTIAAQSPTSLALDVPVGASTGYVTLVAGGVARQSAQQVTVAGSIVVTSFSPATIARGATLTINGDNLDRATGVEYTGGATSAIASRTGSTSIATVVPAGASSGPLTVLGNQGDRVTTATALTVVTPIQVDANATYRVAAGAPVTIPGSGLSAVTAVTVGSSAATIMSLTDTQLVFSVPAGVNCGPITLLAAAQPAVPAGSVIVGAGCTLRAAGIEFAQVLSQVASDPYQRIVPRKELMVRAYVVAETTGNLAPTIRLTALASGTPLGTLTMTGPATVPVLAAGAALPSSLLYNEAQSYNATLPATWVAGGLSVRVDIDPEQRYGTPITAQATPSIGTNTTIDLVLVPLVSGANAPQMPDPALALDELVRRMPVPRERIVVSVRAPYTLTSSTDGVDTSDDWTGALSELEQLRRAEAPSRHYYGMVRPMVSAGTAGIGYVNRVGSSSPNLSSMGWDSTRSGWRRTFTHELGHNFSRGHAPCGGPANPDANYPYADGALSATPLFESLLDDIVSPAGLTDVMGYCSGSWFSDYNFREVQRFLEARPQPAFAQASVQAQAAAGDGELVLLSGRVSADGVRLDPVRRGRGQAPLAVEGAYRLRVRTAAGGSFEAAFDPVPVDHAEPGEQHFFVAIPSPGALAGVDVYHAGARVPERADSLARAQRQPGAKGAPAVQWSETGGRLDLAWDAASFRFASVTHVAGGVRTTLALNRTGGAVALDVTALPRGGEFEVSLSDGLEAHLIVVAR